MAICPACDRSFDRIPGDAVPLRCGHCQSRVLGVYCDLSLIGAGAMGDVYQARRPNMGNRTVAIKIPKEAEGRACSRFEREIAASARLRHENIVCAFDRGEEEGKPYLVMEYVAGCPLSDIVDAQHPLSPAEAARILRQVAAGLAHAAQHHIVNRDIKPDNILVAADGTAKILDYGLALIAELDGSADRVTRNGTLLGTPGFLAPEQANDPRGVSIAADVYALGCTAHYVLTRRPPFIGKDSFAILKQHAGAPRPSVRSKRPDVPLELDDLIQRMMAVSPEARPSPRELIQVLDRMIPHLSAARPSLASSVSGMIDARCPGCQQVLHLRAEMVGKRLVCPNKLCGHRFTIEPQLGATVAYADTPATTPPVAAALDPVVAVDFEPPEAEVLDAEAVEAEPVEAEVVEAEPMEAEPMEAEAVDAEPMEAEAVEAEPVEAEPLEASAACGLAAELPHAEIPEAEALDAEPVEDGAPVTLSSLPAPPQPFHVPPLPGAFELPPVQREIGTVAAGFTETPREDEIQIGQARAIEPPPQPRHAPAPEVLRPPVIAAPAPPPRFRHEPPPAAREASPSNQPAPKPRRKGRRPSMIWVVGGLTCLMLVASGIAGLHVYRKLIPTPDERWAKVHEAYQNKKWDEAVAGFKKFEQDFPADPRVQEIPFFLSMCDVGQQVYSDANTDACLEQMEELFHKYRDEPVYERYPADLYSALKRLVERFTEEATAKLDVAKIERARAAFDLLTTVSQSMEETWVPEVTEKLTTYMQETEAKVRSKRTLKDALALVKEAQIADPAVNPDEVYGKIAALETKFPELLANQEFLAERDAAYRSEPQRVRFLPAEDDPVVPASAASAGLSPPEQVRLAIVWDDRTQAVKLPEQVVTCVSRGVLYVFDARGDLLWFKPLGIDSHRLPARLAATATSPAALVALATDENALLALDAQTGRTLWKYEVHGDLAAPLTIASVPSGHNEPDKHRGLLPTADGDIHVLELVLGKRLGRFVTGQPLASVGGVHDKHNHMVYFPADSKRVFGINPLAIDNPEEQPACKAVLFTDHASGALRSQPTVVDRGTPDSPQAYLIMAEASELERMKLRIFDLSAVKLADPRSKPLATEPILEGWSWFSPLASPDRLTLITDAGDLGVFGLNLDNSQEAIYRVIEKKKKGDRDASKDTTQLPIRDRFRSLAIDSDERYLWVMAGGTLRKLKLDVLGQQIRPVWPTESQPAQVTGVPLHEAQLDDRGDHLFLGLMSTDGSHFDFVAVEARHGKPVWQRQLGVKLFGDPILLGQQVLLLDRSGRTAVLDPESSQTIYQPTGEATLPAGADPQKLIRIADDSGRAYLAVPLSDGRELAIAPLHSPENGVLVWERITLPEPLQGRPCICGDFLIAACADGILRRVPLRPGVSLAVNEQPFHWMPGLNKDPGPERADAYPLSPASILLVAAGRDIRRLEIHDVQNVTRWRQAGGSFESESPLLSPVLTVGERGLATDITGLASAFDVSDPGKLRGAWKLGGRPTGEPFLRGDKLLAVVEGRTLVAIAPGSPENGQPLWSTEPLRGRIRGQPVLSGDVLLVADESRLVTAIQLADGQPAWTVGVSARIGPAAAAVPFGKDRILVPLADGTFSVVPTPAVEKQVAGAGSE